MTKIEEFNSLLEKRKIFQKESKGREEVEILKKIVDLSKEIYGEESNKYIYYLNELGGSSKYIGEYDIALKSLNEAKNIVERLEGSESVSYATCLLNIAEVYRFMGELLKLENIYLEVLEIYNKNNMENNYVYAGLCNNLGLYYQNVDNIKEAIKYHEKSLNILCNMEEHIVEYATTLNNLVMPYRKVSNNEKSLKYLNEALDIYEKKLGKHHSMYSAALNNLAIIKFEDGDFLASLNIFEDALEIVKKSFGENSTNYINLLSNVEYIREIVEKQKNNNVKIEVTEKDKLMDISREYTNKYILPLIKEKIPEILDKITIALIGEGSEVLRYDDEYSRDHDFTFMPSIFLSGEDYDKYSSELKNILLSLPREFLGIKHDENEVISERRGVLKLEDYIYKYLGKEEINLTIEDYKKIPEYSFLAITSGEIFYSGNYKLEKIRENLKYYPDIIRENKIATVCTKIAQTGQYNYLRFRKRGDLLGANQTKSIFIENVIHLVYLLNKKYMPYYKWYSKGLEDLEVLGKDIKFRLEEIIEKDKIDMHSMSNKMEEICYFLVEELKRQKLSNVRGYFLINHATYIQKNIKDEFLKNWSPFED